MLTPPIPLNEAERLIALHRLNILDSPIEERFDRITRLARQLFNVPIALISLVDSDRLWFKSYQGVEVREIPRSISFCAHAVSQDEALIVTDTLLDPRFDNSPLVTAAPFIRFYAGQPLSYAQGLKLGTLCIMDTKPLNLSLAQLEILRDLAAIVENELNSVELTRAIAERERAEAEVHFQAHLLDVVQQSVIATDLQGRIIYWNNFAEQLYGWHKSEVIGHNILDILSFQAGRETVAEIIKERAASSDSLVQEFLVSRRDGTVFPIFATSTPIYDENDELIGLVAVSNDISERKLNE